MLTLSFHVKFDNFFIYSLIHFQTPLFFNGLHFINFWHTIIMAVCQVAALIKMQKFICLHLKRANTNEKSNLAFIITPVSMLSFLNICKVNRYALIFLNIKYIFDQVKLSDLMSWLGTLVHLVETTSIHIPTYVPSHTLSSPWQPKNVTANVRFRVVTTSLQRN